MRLRRIPNTQTCDGCSSPRAGACVLIVLFLAFYTMQFVLDQNREEISIASSMSKDHGNSNILQGVVNGSSVKEAIASSPSIDKQISDKTEENEKHKEENKNSEEYSQDDDDGFDDDNDMNEDRPNDSMFSPYEMRHPRWELPWWARKSSELRSITNNQDRQLCLVHVGRTAGSTIGCAVGFRLHCEEGCYVDSVLARQTTHIFHNTINDCPDKSSDYLFTIRHPLDRLNSIHVHERSFVRENEGMNRAKIYKDCAFTTLNDLAEKGLATNSSASFLCKQRAYNYVRGLLQYGFHAFYNYQHYYNDIKLDESSKVYVIRSEHLSDDWTKIETMLGGQPETIRDMKVLYSSSDFAMDGDEYLSGNARSLLCKALCGEIQVYKTLLDEAVNLSEDDRAISYEELETTCPLQVGITTCPIEEETDRMFRIDDDSSTPCPYEIRMPGWTLPRWAKKAPELRNNAVPKDNEMCFVHVGKTAGSTMGCALGFRLHCAEETYVEGLLSRYTTHVFHSGVNDCPVNATNYLIAVRNPIDRLKSLHVYERPSESGYNNKEQGRLKIYEECPFTTLNELAENGLAENGTASEVCKERAYNHVRGIERFGYHAYFNYQYYYRNLDLYDSTKLFIVRTEHLVDDWNGIEAMLGGEKDAVEDFGHFNPSAQRTVDGDKFLSDHARTLLCQALCDEIQLYKKMLNEAVNLSENDVEIAFEELALSCPREARNEVC